MDQDKPDNVIPFPAPKRAKRAELPADTEEQDDTEPIEVKSTPDWT